MSNDCCERCEGRLLEIDHWGERLRGCPKCNRWQAASRGGMTTKESPVKIPGLKACESYAGWPLI